MHPQSGSLKYVTVPKYPRLTDLTWGKNARKELLTKIISTNEDFFDSSVQVLKTQFIRFKWMAKFNLSFWISTANLSKQNIVLLRWLQSKSFLVQHKMPKQTSSQLTSTSSSSKSYRSQNRQRELASTPPVPTFTRTVNMSRKRLATKGMDIDWIGKCLKPSSGRKNFFQLQFWLPFGLENYALLW